MKMTILRSAGRFVGNILLQVAVRTLLGGEMKRAVETIVSAVENQSLSGREKLQTAKVQAKVAAEKLRSDVPETLRNLAIEAAVAKLQKKLG